MNFTSLTFLFFLFPACLACFYGARLLERWGKLGKLVRKLRLADLILIGFSLAFYMWAGLDNGPLFCLYILVVYAAGKWLGAIGAKPTPGQSTGRGKVYLALGVCMLVAVLVVYKYTGMIWRVINQLLGREAQSISIIAPLGISFITFSAISYLTDIYRGKAKAGSLVDCALYLSFFPKVVSGPIVLWKDFSQQMQTPALNLDHAMDSINRIMIGFAKKVLLADQFGAAIQTMSVWGADSISMALTVLLYMLQIYYDFAGYSDIAIGMAGLFGFRFGENFNFPYRSCSIAEFWRRWHISLGTWFREYVYFPLGGSRRGKVRTLLNLSVVFALTGIWHGAGWNYILWGCINGAFVLLERIFQNKKWFQKIPTFVRWLGTMAITLLCWQLFRFQSIHEAYNWLLYSIGVRGYDLVLYTWQYFVDARLITQVLVGILGATVLGSPRLLAWWGRAERKTAACLVRQIVLFVLFVLAVMFMVNSTYSPFIYFQF